MTSRRSFLAAVAVAPVVAREMRVAPKMYRMEITTHRGEHVVLMCPQIPIQRDGNPLKVGDFLEVREGCGRIDYRYDFHQVASVTGAWV